MFLPDDTIVAVATPPGRGGIGVVRISGSHAPAVADALLATTRPLRPREATFTCLRVDDGAAAASSPAGAPVGDEVVATLFVAPRSYTGEDVVEISTHGSPVVLDEVVRRAMRAGARLAAPGEFTLRAFLNGKRDLIQAEAVADVIAAATPLQARTAFDQLQGTLTTRIAAIDAELFDLIARLEASLDFPDEGYHFVQAGEVAAAIGGLLARVDELLSDARRGRMIRDGATVVIAGRPNVGKSSLFNALCGVERAIVTAIPGTTRDLVTERVDIGGVAVTLVDTAGSRDAHDPVEREGVARGDRARTAADAVILVLDASEPMTDDDRRLLAEPAAVARIVVANKSDRGAVVDLQNEAAMSTAAIAVSAIDGRGIADLRDAITRALTGAEPLRDVPAISNARHAGLTETARDHLSRARTAATMDTPEEFLLSDLQAARAAFDEVVGRRTSEDVLRHIFERFCIGK